ncbi:MAG: hypothetical protein N2322_01285 [Terrimicrobiaceae bacterium]|nr:hypothetical protein [Terrimicrobiaceae bacterium]
MPPPASRLEARDFHLELTLNSGQIFHAMPAGRRWQVLDGKQLFEIEQRGECLLVARGGVEEARRFLALDHNLPEIYRTFPRDAYSREALEACRGMRILRQRPWECLATFLASPMKQVAHIRAISLALRERYGEAVRGSLVRAFPRPERLARLGEKALRACGLGFRAKNVLAAARRVAEGAADLEALRALPTDRLREALCEFPGVGRKIANCVLLFAYERLEVVPVDVWIGRIAARMRGRGGVADGLERFAVRRFGPCAGYVQQYLFHHARTTGKLPSR